MTAEAVQEDDRRLRWSVYTTEAGWSPSVVFSDHQSVSAPALVEINGTVCCVHRGADDVVWKDMPLHCTSFIPSSTTSYVTKWEEARKPLPTGASAEQVEQREKTIAAASEDLAQALAWTPDQELYNLPHSVETPALVNDAGTLGMVYTSTGADYLSNTWLHEFCLELHGSRLLGEGPYYIERASPAAIPLSVGPALAAFDGKVHLVFARPEPSGNLLPDNYGGLGHLVRKAAGDWQPVRAADGHAITAPRHTFMHESGGSKETFLAHGYPGNVALAVHDGALHVVYRQGQAGGTLMHAYFNGSLWTEGTPICPPGADGGTSGNGVQESRAGAALASYGGKLHAVYPSATNGQVQHLTWTKEGGWTAPVAIEGHDSNNSPALTVFKEGPAGKEREVLLMVHRGGRRQ